MLNKASKNPVFKLSDAIEEFNGKGSKKENKFSSDLTKKLKMNGKKTKKKNQKKNIQREKERKREIIYYFSGHSWGSWRMLRVLDRRLE